jgi:hypothetical protein
VVCDKLRIDPGDGSPIVDYRIENGCVEARTLETERGTSTEKPWRQLTPEQVTSHVMSDTVVARWLRRRMGVHQLVRACTLPLSCALPSTESAPAAERSTTV